jgi:hypothetical protein
MTIHDWNPDEGDALQGDVVERLRALARHEHSDLSIGHEAADIIDVHRKTIEIANAGWNKDHSELTRLRTENEALREALKSVPDLHSLATNFEVTGPDADGLVWLVLHGNGTAGRAMVNLGTPDQLVAQVALHLEKDRRAALSKATGGSHEQG